MPHKEGSNHCENHQICPHQFSVRKKKKVKNRLDLLSNNQNITRKSRLDIPCIKRTKLNLHAIK